MKYIAAIFVLPIIVAIVFYFAWKPQMNGELVIPNLSQPVTVTFDGLANPVIKASSRLDAYNALGFITARERLFQMDLMRRKSAGKLSEIFGAPALAVDKQSRILGLEQLAKQIYQQLPPSQQGILKAYSNGINAHLQSMWLAPVECLMLGYTPKPWVPSDSLLVGLNIFRTLNQNEVDERMLTVMNAALPPSVVAFLTPDTGIYTQAALLVKDRKEKEVLPKIPVQLLQHLSSANRYPVSGLADLSAPQPGSNQWAISQGGQGHAILANDMHLPLAVPDIWYQAALSYQGVIIKGITLPGLPMIVTGTNGTLAWGFTNAQADVLDLISLTINPDNPKQYKTPEGWKDFTYTDQLITIKGEPEYQLKISNTIWGPVSLKPLLGKPVVLQWTIFKPNAVNLDLIEIDHIQNIESAITLFQNAGLPAMNVMLADQQGQIAWTLTGKLPERYSLKGDVSLSWEESDRGWLGLIPSDRYPQIKNPESGMLVTANNRVLPQQDTFQYGLDFSNSYRAYRITEMLQASSSKSMQSFYQMQLDTKSEFYEFYQQLAFSVLSETLLNQRNELLDLQSALQKWTGHADADSIGFGLLVEFRKNLMDTVLSEYLAACRKIEPGFKYRWFNSDTPLRLLLTEQNAATLPISGAYTSWGDLILKALEKAGNTLNAKFPNIKISDLSWGQMQQFSIQHPFSLAGPGLEKLLDMPKMSLSGCKMCVRVSGKNFGASMRMIVSPGEKQDMIMILTTGQSGHPFSEHYGDQYQFWVQGLLPEPVHKRITKQLLLTPAT